jgi:hypothetical protein
MRFTLSYVVNRWEVEETKLEFSEPGFRLLTAREPWDERRALVEQLSVWLGHALVDLKQRHNAAFTSLVPDAALNGKITRGDNHQGFPYLLLDYPNHFSKDDILAARNMIWFGNGFHCTLHVRGNDLVSRVLNNLEKQTHENFFICTNVHEWIHDVNENDWISAAHLTEATRNDIHQRGWIKLGRQLNLHQPDSWQNDLVETYKAWNKLLQKVS